MIIVMSQLAVLMPEQDPGRQKTAGLPGCGTRLLGVICELNSKEGRQVSGGSAFQASPWPEHPAQSRRSPWRVRPELTLALFVLKQILILKMCMDTL